VSELTKGTIPGEYGLKQNLVLIGNRHDSGGAAGHVDGAAVAALACVVAIAAVGAQGVIAVEGAGGHGERDSLILHAPPLVATFWRNTVSVMLTVWPLTKTPPPLPPETLPSKTVPVMVVCGPPS
jgi:hypothetical protein